MPSRSAGKTSRSATPWAAAAGNRWLSGRTCSAILSVLPQTRSKLANTAGKRGLDDSRARPCQKKNALSPSSLNPTALCSTVSSVCMSFQTNPWGCVRASGFMPCYEMRVQKGDLIMTASWLRGAHKVVWAADQCRNLHCTNPASCDSCQPCNSKVCSGGSSHQERCRLGVGVWCLPDKG